MASSLLLPCLCMPTLPWWATVWICPLELRECHGGCSLFPINKNCRTQEGFCAQEPRRVWLGFTPTHCLGLTFVLGVLVREGPSQKCLRRLRVTVGAAVGLPSDRRWPLYSPDQASARPPTLSRWWRGVPSLQLPPHCCPYEPPLPFSPCSGFCRENWKILFPSAHRNGSALYNHWLLNLEGRNICFCSLISRWLLPPEAQSDSQEAVGLGVCTVLKVRGIPSQRSVKAHHLVLEVLSHSCW